MRQLDCKRLKIKINNHLRWFCGGLNSYRNFSRFLSEVYEIKGMSGIEFEAVPLISAVFGMTSFSRHFDFSLKFVKIK